MRPALAWRPLLGLAGIQALLCLWANGPAAYGLMTDELYYLDCADRLAWGYVDHPPFSIAILWATRELLGDSVLAVRAPVMLVSCGVLLLVGALAREMGGGARAQTLAALGMLCAPLFHAMSNFYSMNILEVALWATAAWLMLRLVNTGRPALWLALGAVLGVALLNKVSTLWLGAALAGGMLFTPQRRWLRTPWPWAAGLLALLIFTPNLVWQSRNDWAMAEFLRNSATAKEFTFASPLGFLAGQLFIMGWPVWLEGLYWLLREDAGRRYRWLGLVFLGVFGLLLFSGSAKIYYTAPLYPIVFAAAGVRLESLPRRIPGAAFAWIVGGLVSLPFTMSVVPVETLASWHRALGLAGPTVDVTAPPPIQQGLAQMFHGRAVAEAVSRAWEGLSEEERDRVGILTGQFGEAGGIHYYGRELGLPGAIGTDVSYWLWGPGDVSGELMLILSDDEADLRRRYGRVERVAEIECAWCMPYLTRKAVYLCRDPVRPLTEEWPELKSYE